MGLNHALSEQDWGVVENTHGISPGAHHYELSMVMRTDVVRVQGAVVQVLQEAQQN